MLSDSFTTKVRIDTNSYRDIKNFTRGVSINLAKKWKMELQDWMSAMILFMTTFLVTG